MKTEKDYKELSRLGQKLGIPVFEAFLELEVFDKNGKTISKHKQRSHSWTRNAYNLMFSQLAGKDVDDSTFGAGKLSYKEQDTTVEYGNGPMGWKAHESADLAHGAGASDAAGYRAEAGVDSAGIQVGGGDTAESFEDYVLDTLIANGTGAGELSYVESEAHAITWTVGTLTLKNELIRYFNNNSGGAIDVKEVGLVGQFQNPGGTYSSSAQEALVARDVLGATVEVPDTGQLKVTYTVSLVYAA